MNNYEFLEPALLYAGVVVEVVDSNHAMVGWRGTVTSPSMWPTPKYKPIPPNHYRIEMDSGGGRFYGDYERGQLKVIRLPGGQVRPKSE